MFYDAMGRLKKSSNSDGSIPEKTLDIESIDKVSKHMSPKVLLKRIALPLNGPIKSKPESSIHLIESSPEDEPMEKKTQETTKPSEGPQLSLLEKLSVKKTTPTTMKHSTILIQKMPIGTLIRNLPANNVMNKLSTSPVVAAKAPAVVKKLPSVPITKKLPPHALLKPVVEALKLENIELLKGDTNANKDDSVDINYKSNTPTSSEDSEKKLEEVTYNDHTLNVRKKKLERVRVKIPHIKPTKNNLKQKQELVSNTENLNKPEPASNPKKLNKLEPVLDPDNLTPVRISARLKNRKEKFNVVKLLRGSSFYESSLKKEKLKASAIIEKKKKPAPPTKKVFTPKGKDLINEPTLKVNADLDLDFSVELGPEITVTRVKNSRADKRSNKDIANDNVTVTEGKISKKSKVTQTYDTVVKLKADKSDWTVGVSTNKTKVVESDHHSSEDTPKSKVQKRAIKVAVETPYVVTTPPVESSPIGELSSQGKKTAKVTPLTQVKGGLKSEATTSPIKVLSPAKRPFDEDDFEKYFITKTRICEHNDSLDSDSEDDGAELSHFVDFRRDVAFSTETPTKQVLANETTIYDLILDISNELPAWNLHVLEDTNSFCIAHIARGPIGVPVMKKIVEIDGEYNAKVYINQTLRNEYRGIYNSYESIRNLILTLDKL